MQKRRAAQPADVDDARDFRWAVTVWVMIFIDDVSAVAFTDVLRGDGNSFLKDLQSSRHSFEAMRTAGGEVGSSAARLANDSSYRLVERM